MLKSIQNLMNVHRRCCERQHGREPTAADWESLAVMISQYLDVSMQTARSLLQEASTEAA